MSSSHWTSLSRFSRQVLLEPVNLSGSLQVSCCQALLYLRITLCLRERHYRLQISSFSQCSSLGCFEYRVITLESSYFATSIPVILASMAACLWTDDWVPSWSRLVILSHDEETNKCVSRRLGNKAAAPCDAYNVGRTSQSPPHPGLGKWQS